MYHLVTSLCQLQPLVFKAFVFALHAATHFIPLVVWPLLCKTHMSASPWRPFTNPPGASLASPPLLSSPVPNQALYTDRVILAIQVRNINIQRTVESRIGQQLLQCSHRRTQRITWGPVLTRQQRKTDLPCLEMDVRMAYRRDKLDLGRCERVVLWDRQV